MSGADRRGTERRPMRVRVDYHHEGNYLISYSRDLSPDGVYVCTRTPAPVGSTLTLVFPVEGPHEVRVTAMVVWVPMPESPAEPGMGLQFIDLPDSLRKALLDIIHRVAVLPDGDDEDGPCGSA